MKLLADVEVESSWSRSTAQTGNLMRFLRPRIEPIMSKLSLALWLNVILSWLPTNCRLKLLFCLLQRWPIKVSNSFTYCSLCSDGSDAESDSCSSVSEIMSSHRHSSSLTTVSRSNFSVTSICSPPKPSGAANNLSLFELARRQARAHSPALTTMRLIRSFWLVFCFAIASNDSKPIIWIGLNEIAHLWAEWRCRHLVQ